MKLINSNTINQNLEIQNFWKRVLVTMNPLKILNCLDKNQVKLIYIDHKPVKIICQDKNQEKLIYIDLKLVKLNYLYQNQVKLNN